MAKSVKRVQTRAIDPLVPLDRQRLAAAVAVYDGSLEDIARAARKAGAHCSKQNLYGLATRRGPRAARCRRSLRSALAKGLGVPVAWLSGKHDLEVWGPARTHTDLNWRFGPDSPFVRGTREQWERLGVRKPPNDDRPPLYELIAYRFTKDLRKVVGPDEPAREVVRRVLSLTLWQHWLFGDRALGTIDETDMDDFARAVGKAVVIALRPGLSRGAPVLGGRFAQMADALKQVR